MKLIYTLAFAVLFLGVSSQNTPNKKKSTQPVTRQMFSCPDFREMKWGAHRDSILKDGVPVNFAKVNTKSDSNSYFVPNDDLTIGTVFCDQIYYVFNSANRLVKVRLVFPRKQLGEMKYILRTKFDDPTNINESGGGYQLTWSNIEEVRLTLNDYPDVNQAIVEFSSDFEILESKRINQNVDDF